MVETTRRTAGTRSIRWSALAAVSGLLLAACGDDAGMTAGDTTTTTAATTTTPPPASDDAAGEPEPEAPEEPPAAWAEVAVAGDGPPPTTNAVLVAAPDDTLWLHGGRVGDTVVGDLWRLDGETWERIETAGPAPEPREEHVAVWDDAADRLVVATGQTAGQEVFDDVWAFDPATSEWELLAGGGGPSARYGSCAVVDDEGRLVVSHGFSPRERFADTWAFDVAAATWTDITPAEGPAPVARCLHTCGWDADAGELVLFGGQTNEAPVVGDTWRLAADGWREVTAEGPAARRHVGSVHTDDGFRIVGGQDSDGLVDDAWLLRDDAWESGPAEAPSARHSHAMAAGDSVVWLFGGTGPDGDLADLWRYG